VTCKPGVLYISLTDGASISPPSEISETLAVNLKTNMLKETFIKLSGNYTGDSSLVNELWTEIEHQYSTKRRHYHTLEHLENLFEQLIQIKSEIQDWDIILFSLYYHDIIYNPLKSDNEEKSAVFAEKRLKQMSIPINRIEACKKQILATESTNNDTNYFTDADLSILGKDWKIYFTYLKNVRKEYSIYPDFIYNSGRKKVLNYFCQCKEYLKQIFFMTNLKNMQNPIYIENYLCCD